MPELPRCSISVGKVVEKVVHRSQGGDQVRLGCSEGGLRVDHNRNGGHIYDVS